MQHVVYDVTYRHAWLAIGAHETRTKGTGMTGLVESIRTNHKRQGFAPHVCTECRLAWPCEALVAAQRIEATLALCDRIEDEARNFEPISADGDVAMGTRIHMMGLVRHVLTGIFDEVQP